MKLLEVKNNLIKISYADEEKMALGRFITVGGDNNSYVAQIINLKTDLSSNNAIAKLMFVFDENGVVDSYDGTVPSVNSKLSFLSAKEILNLLPVEKPVKIGVLAQQHSGMIVDKSFFEGNLVVCAEKFDNISDITYNFITELSKYEDKIVVIDTDNNFDEYDSIRLRKDFRIPLNCQMIDFLFQNELSDIDLTSKAVIEEIFDEVREYAKTVDFIPFESFINIISKQYDETQIPELALLKNKLKKYYENNIFIQRQSEMDALLNYVKEKRISFINISDISDELQREVIDYIYSSLESALQNTYVFIKINNKNSNKKLLKHIVNSDLLFTTIICSHVYMYLPELKQRAKNIVFFAPQTVQHDFATYNAFLNKLNLNEFVVYGAHTYGVPFIVDMSADDSVVAKDDESAIDEIQQIDVKEETDILNKNEAYVSEGLQPLNEIDETSITDDTVSDAFDNDAVEQVEDLSLIAESDLVVDNEIDNEINIDDIDGDNKTLSHEELVEQVAKDVDDIFITNKTSDIPPIENILGDNEQVDELSEDDLDTIENIPEIVEDEEIDLLSESDIVEDESAKEPLEVSVEEFDSNLTVDHTESDEEQIMPTEVFDDKTISSDNGDVLDIVDVESEQETEELPVYPTDSVSETNTVFDQGDLVSHPKYGKGVIEKIIKYGNKMLCSISFEDVGRRLLDPAISDLQKI